jgi:hypothetical protein
MVARFVWAFEKILSSKSERGTFILSEYKSTRGETILILKKGEQMIKPNELLNNYEVQPFRPLNINKPE